MKQPLLISKILFQFDLNEYYEPLYLLHCMFSELKLKVGICYLLTLQSHQPETPSLDLILPNFTFTYSQTIVPLTFFVPQLSLIASLAYPTLSYPHLSVKL